MFLCHSNCIKTQQRNVIKEQMRSINWITVTWRIHWPQHATKRHHNNNMSHCCCLTDPGRQTDTQWQTTDPRIAVSMHAKYFKSHRTVIKPFLLHGQAAEYRPRWWVWSTVVRRPSDVYDTHRQTKLTVPKTISHSRDMNDAYQNLNGSHDLTTPISGMTCHPWASSAVAVLKSKPKRRF